MFAVAACAVSALAPQVGGAQAADVGANREQFEGRAAFESIAAAVAEAAQRFDIPAAWIWAVMRAESAMDPWAVSPKGAMGLMQLMPDTWQAWRLGLGLGDDPFEVRDNVLAGAAFLRDLRDRFGAAGMFAAYNAGPGRYAEFLTTGRPLPAETRAYVVRVSKQIGPGFFAPGVRDERSVANSEWTQSSLFASLGSHSTSATSAPAGGSGSAPSDPLFVRPQAEVRP